ncbi:MAG: GNAT family N-acetyltransferase [Candidatus Coatesbacteria bacterium]|nr:GNAT family N-acetyltransferase [Candidatus Coatesbacteria bacterium]
MILRTITKADLPQFRELLKYCFFMTTEETIKWFPENRVNRYSFGIFDGKILASAAVFFPFQIWLSTDYHKMAGVTSVVTRPEYRRKGLVDKLMIHLQEKMNEYGFYMSSLMPFKFSFYKRMGWEYGSFIKQFTFKPEQMEKINAENRTISEGSWERDIPKLYEIREKILKKRYEGWNKREKVFLKQMFLVDVSSKLYFIKNGHEITGCFISYVEKKKPEKNLVIAEPIFAEKDDLDAIMAFSYNHLDHLKEIDLYTAMDVEIWNYLREPRITIKIIPQHQHKIINVEKALENIKINKDISGEITFVIDNDSSAPWNNRNYLVEASKGRMKVTKSNIKSDSKLTIQTFSQIFFGLKSVDELIWEKKIQINKKELTLFRKIFPKRNFWFLDWF